MSQTIHVSQRTKPEQYTNILLQQHGGATARQLESALTGEVQLCLLHKHLSDQAGACLNACVVQCLFLAYMA